MEKIRIGVVGLGHRGRDMLKTSSFFKCVEIVAGCDLNPKNWFEQQWLSNASMADMFPGATFYEKYDDMLDKANLDLVIVETGADIHAEFCAKALDKNINVLTDIPVVANLKEAELLWKAAEKSSAMITVGSNPNYQRFAEMLRDFHKKGLLGKPYCMEAEYIHWSLPKSDMSIHLNENGDWRRLLCPIRYCTHSLGPLLEVLDEELRYVSCFGTGSHSDDVPASYKKDDMQCAQFQTESGVVIRVMRNGRCRADIGHHMYRVFGTEGYIEKTERFEKMTIRYNSMKELDTGLKEVDGSYMPAEYKNNPDAAASGHGGVDYAMMDYVFKALLGDKNPPISLRKGLAMTLPGIYAEESAKRGGEVMKMKYPWDPDWTGEF